MPFLLDTNTCIDLMRKQPDVVKRMFGVAPGDCFVSTVSTYELYTGVAKCAAPDRERAKVDLCNLDGLIIQRPLVLIESFRTASSESSSSACRIEMLECSIWN